MRLLFSISDLFYIPGQGTVVSGVVQHGTVYAGQTVVLRAPLESIEAQVLGVEVDKEQVASAKSGQTAGLLFASVDPMSLPSGVSKTDEGCIEVHSLQIETRKRPWWQFW